LAQLKALRSMWQSLLGASVKDLTGAGGSGGGGSDSSTAYTHALERWYK